MKFEETTGLSDQEFMAWLYETFAPLLWGTAKRYCRKQALWEEIIQDSMVRLLACVPRLRGLQAEKLPAYLAVTVRNTAYTQLKKVERDQKLFVSLESIDLPDDGPTLEERLLQAETVDELFTICDRLRPKDRALLLRYSLGSWKTEELAEQFGYQTASVRVRVSRVRRQVKQQLLEST